MLFSLSNVLIFFSKLYIYMFNIFFYYLPKCKSEMKHQNGKISNMFRFEVGLKWGPKQNWQLVQNFAYLSGNCSSRNFYISQKLSTLGKTSSHYLGIWLRGEEDRKFCISMHIKKKNYDHRHLGAGRISKECSTPHATLTCINYLRSQSACTQNYPHILPCHHSGS